MNDDPAIRWRRQKALFQEALDRDPRDRAALLASARAEDPGLAAEVESMLAAHGESGAFLDAPFLDPGARGEGPATGADVLEGAVLEGKYRVEARLGRGGMGSVYRATHLWTGRPVAVKIIAPEFMAKPEFVERFKREAKAAGRLRHPNVVNVTDFGFAPAGGARVAYLVMEYLDGETLAGRLAREPRLPVPLAVDILDQVCLAVGEAHARGILHRDLKPANIWLEPDRRGGVTAKVLDFGLAKLREADGARGEAGDPGAGRAAPALFGRTLVSGETSPDFGDPPSPDPAPAGGAPRAAGSAAATLAADRRATPAEIDPRTVGYALTRVGAVMGTPAYMAPEQWRAEALTPAADIYGLGVVAYEMLGGAPPFAGDAERLHVLHAEAPPPPLRALRRDIAPEIDRLVSSALAKSPADRPPSAAAFAAALRAMAQGEPALLRRARRRLQSGGLARPLATAQALFVLAGCLLVSAATGPWAGTTPAPGTAQAVCTLLALAAFLAAADAAAAAAGPARPPGGLGRQLGRAARVTLASLATVRPGWLFAAQAAAAEDVGVGGALGRSSRLAAPFAGFATRLFLRRLRGGIVTLTAAAVAAAVAGAWASVVAGSVTAGAMPVPPAPAAVALAATLAAAMLASHLTGSRAAVARAMLYAAARAFRGEPSEDQPDLERSAAAPPPRRRLGAAPLVASVLLASLGFGAANVLIVPPAGPPLRAPRPRVARVPDGDNAWVLYHRAIEAAGFETAARSDSERRITSLARASLANSGWWQVEQDLRSYADRARADLTPAQRALVLERQGALDLMAEGAARPAAQYTSELPTWSSPIPSLVACRSVVAIASARARMLADEGRAGEAARLYLAAYEMSTDYGDPSTGYVGALSAVAAHSTLGRAMRAWLAAGGADADTEVAVARRLEELDARGVSAAACLAAEIDVNLRGFEDLLTGRGREAGSGALGMLEAVPGLRARAIRSAAALVETRREQLPLLERWDLAAYAREVEREKAELERWHGRLDLGRWAAPGMLVGDSASILMGARAMYEGRADAAALRAMVIADAYRKRFGRFPEALEAACAALGLDVPRDVTTGAPAGYRLEGGVPVVWLPGVDGVDGGGLAACARGRSPLAQTDCDLVYRWGEHEEPGP